MKRPLFSAIVLTVILSSGFQCFAQDATGKVNQRTMEEVLVAKPGSTQQDKNRQRNAPQPPQYQQQPQNPQHNAPQQPQQPQPQQRQQNPPRQQQQYQQPRHQQQYQPQRPPQQPRQPGYQQSGYQRQPYNNQPNISGGSRYGAPSNQWIYTFYQINSIIGNGLVADDTWRRQAPNRVIDTYYQPTMSRIPEDHLPPMPEKGKPDPFLDETKAILTSHYTTYGNEATFDNASPYKEMLAIELFGYGYNVPYDLVDPVRQAVANGAINRGRYYVVDAQSVLQQQYGGEYVYYGGNSGLFHPTERMENLYCAGVRYVLSGYISQYYIHRYKSSPSSKYFTYESAITVHLTGYDLDTQTILQTKVLTLHGTGSTQEYADESAIRSLSSYTFSFCQSNFKIISFIAQLGEPNKNGKSKTCLISAGSELGLQKTDLFNVFEMEMDGTMKNIGKVKVTKVVGTNAAECNITSGADKVTKAYLQGKQLVLLSREQAFL